MEMPNRPRILRELALATLAGTVIGLSPLVPQHWVGSTLAGLVTGGVVLGVRLRRAATVEEVEATGARWSISPWVAASVLLWLALFAPAWMWLYRQWTGSLWSNEHGIFIPFIVAYLVHSTLRRDPEPQREEGSAWGLPWLALGGGLAALDAPIHTGYLAVVGLLVSLPGLSLVLLGRRRTRELAVPLMVALLMMPIPRTLATDLALRHVTAVAVDQLLFFFGFAVLRDATVLRMPGRTFIITDACSGFSTLYAGFAVAFILACTADSHARRLLLIVAAPVLAIAANVTRVLLLVLLTNRFGNWVIDTAFHPATGVATFLIVLGGLLALSRWRVVKPSAA